MAHIDPALLLSLLFLGFLFSYKLIFSSFRVASKDFRNLPDIILGSCFFILLLVPLSRINFGDRSKQENRMLATFKPLFDEHKRLNLTFGRDFEKWFNDRFNQRDRVIRAHDWVRYKLNTKLENNVAYVGKRGWMFIKDDFSIFDPFTKDDIQKIGQQIIKLREFSEARKMKLYILIVPNKEEVYKEFSNRPTIQERPDRTRALVEAVRDQTGFQIVYPHSELLQAKARDYIFFKTDHHWTESGTFVAYQALMKQIQNDFSDIGIADLATARAFKNRKVRAEIDRTFGEGYMYRVLNMNDDSVLDVDYTYYDFPQSTQITSTAGSSTDSRIFSGPHGTRNIVILGNSFTENLMQFIPLSFKRTLKLRSNAGNVGFADEIKIKRFEKEILGFKPDALVLVMQSSYVPHLKTMFGAP